ncbi:hypothetical protein [Pontimicrobium sp. SW4]|uniref:Uncharacterized protein n=1 Tax=Pontimicrobium sp. SW4 TaxID=3153519 RepID=A0AAU7BRA8_9FLAO
MKNFTIYRLAILNKAKEEQVLNYFNGDIDLFKEFEAYYKSLSLNIIAYQDNKGNKRTFSITSEIKTNFEERIIIANLDSAYTGDTCDVRNGDSNSLDYIISKDQLQSRKMFSLLYIPKGLKHGYVVFENKSKHGVKIVFEREFNRFLKEKGYDDFRLIMSPGLNYNYLNNMIEKGKLKKVRLINYRLSDGVQLSLWRNLNNSQKGTEHTEELKFSSKVENDFYKKELSNLFFAKVDLNEKVYFVNQFEIDEISFEINYNNSSKTFYLKDRKKMRSNIDVSGRLKFVGDEATFESKKRVALELINEIMGYKVENENNLREIESEILSKKKGKATKVAAIFAKAKSPKGRQEESLVHKKEEDDNLDSLIDD